MRRRVKNGHLNDSSKSVSKNGRSKMSSENLRTVCLDISWSNIQDQIASLIYAMAKGKLTEKDEIVSVNLKYAGGFVAHDKIIPVELVVKKGVQIKHFG